MRHSENDNRAIWITITVMFIVLSAGGYLASRAMSGAGGSKSPTTSNQPQAQVGRQQQSLAEGAKIDEIIAARQTWDADFVSWYGQPVADFSVRDITGAEHSLSDYLGKDVVVVFWATWCPACNAEIPHLIKLRDTLGPDKLQILAISNEPVDLLAEFVDSKEINYVVATMNSPLPPPLSRVQGIPTTFFIDPKGRLKLTATGVVSLEEDIAILNAP